MLIALALSFQYLSQMWQSALLKRWDEIGAREFLNRIGVDFEHDFRTSLESSNLKANPYAENIWEIFPNSQIKEGVLHCYPKLVGKTKVIWEEWFLLNGELRHHVLSNQPLPNEEGVWTPEPGDTDHPQEVITTSWHYRNDLNRKPSLI